MSVIHGTSGNDFIHPEDDGRTAPPGYTDVTYVVQEFGVVIDAGAGTDFVYGTDGDDEFDITTASDISGLSEVYDGGLGADSLTIRCTGEINLSTVSLNSIESIGLYNTTDETCHVFITGDQLSTLQGVAGSSPRAGITNIVELSCAGHINLTSDGAYVTGIDVLRGSGGDDIFDIAAYIFGGTIFDGAAGDDVIRVSYEVSIGSHGQIFSLLGGEGNDTLTGGRGTFTLDGGAGKDSMTAGNKGDTLDGGKGEDTLFGRGGADLLTGGGGRDTFKYTAVTDSAPGKSDTITDFKQSQGDRIDLHKIDADTNQAGDQAFHLVSGGTFTGHAGELIQTDDGAGHTLLQADVNGDGAADLVVMLNGAPTLVAADFVL